MAPSPRGKRGRGRGRGFSLLGHQTRSSSNMSYNGDDAHSFCSNSSRTAVEENGKFKCSSTNSTDNINHKNTLEASKNSTVFNSGSFSQEKDGDSSPLGIKIVECRTIQDDYDTDAEDIAEEVGEDFSEKAAATPSAAGDNDPAIEFTVDDTELAEFDTEDLNDSKTVGTRMATKNFAANIAVQNNSEKKVADIVGTKGISSATSTPQSTVKSSKPSTSEKKIKRRFGLEYIVVSVSMSSNAPSSMRDSPHECVLCLPGQAFNATILAKHVHSAQHLSNVMELHCRALYHQHKSSEDAELLHQLLSEALAEPEQPVKLLVVTESKLEETRKRIMTAIKERRDSFISSAIDLRSKLDGLRDRGQQQLQVVQKQVREESAGADSEEPPCKRAKTKHLPSTSKSAPAKSVSTPEPKSVLIVGDERAKQLCDACPELEAVSTLAWYPGGHLQKVLTGAMMRLNSSYKVVVVVALLNDFVLEKTDGSKKLHMMNPQVEELGNIASKFANKVRIMNPAMKIIFTVPAYVDFIQYTKRLKHLSQADFARLEDFSRQIMNSFKQMHEGLRYMSKNTFSFNMNITLRDPSQTVQMSKSGRPPNAERLMQFYPNTLTDGLHLSKEAITRVASEINERVQKMVKTISAFSPPVSNTNLIECWADCDNILIIGDHHTFKFETAAPLDMIKNVRLVGEKFQSMSSLLALADKMLNSSVDVLIMVGFYREFAQNVINGRYTILEPKVPCKDDLFGMLKSYVKKWSIMYPRLTMFFTIPQVVDFYSYNVTTNKNLEVTSQFTNQMNIYTHQFSINIMSFYKELRPTITMGSKRTWLYHITNSLYEGHEDLLPTLGNFNVKPQFPPKSTFDGFKPNQATSLKMRADFVTFVTNILRKHPVVRFIQR